LRDFRRVDEGHRPRPPKPFKCSKCHDEFKSLCPIRP
jgi:hypothetical protein